MQRKVSHRQSGFTLIEVMVVIVILGVLAALIVPNVMGRGEKAKVDTTKIALQNIAGSLDQYKLDNGHYPNSQEGGLEALITQPATAKNWCKAVILKVENIQKTVGKMICNMSSQVLKDVLSIYILLALTVNKVAKEMMLIFIISRNN